MSVGGFILNCYSYGVIPTLFPQFLLSQFCYPYISLHFYLYKCMLLLANNYAVVNVSDENSVCVIPVKWMSGDISIGAKVVVTWTDRKRYSAEMLAFGITCSILSLEKIIIIYFIVWIIYHFKVYSSDHHFFDMELCSLATKIGQQQPFSQIPNCNKNQRSSITWVLNQFFWIVSAFEFFYGFCCYLERFC